jgi:ABC-2 type transport system ATP-binding protein
MALADSLEGLKGLDVVTEMPTLSQICVAVMKHNSKLYTGSIL